MFITYFYIYTLRSHRRFLFFFFNDTATTEIYTLSLHDALPICLSGTVITLSYLWLPYMIIPIYAGLERSEEHTSELQSHLNLVCRLLLEKKKQVDRLKSAEPVIKME